MSGFVLGVLALVFAFIPLIGVIAWLLAPIGLVLSAIGLTKPRNGLAIAGLILSCVALMICGLWLLAFAL